MSDAPQHQQLDHAVVGGMAWTAGAKWATQVVTWASVFLVARRLSPAEFGIVEMSGIFANITNVLAEFGLASTILQMRELDRRVLAQLNTVSVFLSTLIFVFSAAASPLVAAFFRSNLLVSLVIVNSLAFFTLAFQAVPLGLLQRDMDFRRLSLVEATQAVVQALSTVACAYAGLSYWSLVIGSLAGRTAAMGLSMYWKPVPFAWPNRSELLKPLRFGLEISMARLAWILYLQADGVIVGRFLGQAALGSYRMAMTLANGPAEKIATLIMRVTGPLFARVQDDQPLLRRYLTFISDGLALAIFPLVFGLIITAPHAVSVTLGPQWTGAVLPLQWLALSMIFRTAHTLFSQVLTSLRFTNFLMWQSILASVVLPVAFYLSVPWGTAGVAACWSILTPLMLLPLGIRLFRAINANVREYLMMLMPATIAVLVMSAVVLLVRPAGWSALPALIFEAAVGAAVYGGVLLIFFRPTVMRYVRFGMRIRKGGGPLPEEVSI